MNPPQIILGSSSPYRKSLLERLNISFSCVSPDIDETALPNESAYDLALRLAVEKASAVSNTHTNAIVIGSDQVAACDGTLLGKPHTVDNAINQLSQCSGKKVTFFTGLCIKSDDKAFSYVSEYHVFFRSLNEEEIKRYIEAEQPLNCAGSFKTEGLGITLFEKQSGDDPTSLIGLPLIKTAEFLRNFGVALP